MGNGGSKERDKNATGFGTSSAGHYTHSEAAEILSGHDVTSRLELTFSATKLKNTDTFGKSDPFVVVTQHTQSGFKEMARTEIVANNLNPKWVNCAYLSYNFDEIQDIQIEVYDCKSSFKSSDSSHLKLGAQTLIGKCRTCLAELVANKSWQQTLVSKKGKAAGVIKVQTEELANTNVWLTMGLACEKIPNRTFHSRNSTFLRLSKKREDGTWSQCYKTEVVIKNKAPNFKKIKGPVLQLTNGDMYRPLKIEAFDYQSNGEHFKLGEVTTTLNDLEEMHNSKGILEFDNPEARRNKGKGKMGFLKVYAFEKEMRPTFLKFIQGGMDMNFVVAVDFTMSNQDPRQPNSLHYLDPTGQRLNDYARAILGVGQVLDYYDTSKTYPCYGFGGKGPNGVANHCFALNGVADNPYVAGVDGILGAYYQALQNMQLSGPTIISQVINQAAFMASQRPISQESQHYTVLLILTDGVINDKAQTIQAIVNASALPMSILILGVDNEDFTEMDKLDGDSAVLQTRTGQKTKRDIVQFVSMRALEKKYSGSRNHQAMIAKALLEELPEQVLEYFKTVRITPNDPAPPPLYVEPDENADLSAQLSNFPDMSVPPLPPPG